MVGIGTWINTTIELIVYLLLGWWLVGGPEGTVIGIVCLALLLYFGVRFLLMLATFVLASRHWKPAPREHRQGTAALARVFLDEYRVSLLVFGLLQPLRWVFDRIDPSSKEERQDLPVLLVHGFLCNGATWRSLQRYLTARGIGGLHTISLEPVFNDIDRYAAQLATRVDEILRTHQTDKVILVAHSMGGLVSRAYIDRLDGASKVAGVVTLGTPHHGTALGTLMRGRNITQMRRGSDWLAALNKVSEARPSVPVTAMMTWQDNIVVPQPSACLGGANNVEISGMGHLAMLFSTRCQELVLREIQDLRKDRLPAQPAVVTEPHNPGHK
jgi:pimeloyl-ACP methyl ester carboxylesterase